MRVFRAAVTATAAVLLTGVLAPAAPAAQKQEGVVASQTFRNPVNSAADPSLMFYNGKYYVATTRGDRIGIWSSASLATLLVQPEQVVWRDSDTSRNTQMWAPAFRHVGGRWYIYGLGRRRREPPDVCPRVGRRRPARTVLLQGQDRGLR